MLGLVSAPILTRYLGVVNFGRLSLVTSLMAIVAAVTEGGLGALGTRELAVREGADRVALMRDLVGIRLGLTLVGIAAATVIAAASHYGPVLVAGTAVAGVALLVYVLQAILSLPLAVELRVGWITVIDLLRQASYLLVVVTLVVLGSGLVPLLGAAVPGGLVGLFVTMRLVRGRVPLRPAFDRSRWRSILRDTLPIAAAGAIYSVYFRVVMLLMAVLASDAEVGYFALSFRITEVAILLPGMLIGTMLPLYSRAARDDQVRLAFAFRLTSEVAVVGGVGLTMLGVVGAPLAIAFLTGSGTGPAVEVVRIQSLALTAVFVNVVLGTTFVALRRNRTMMLTSSSALLVTVVGVLALAGAHGAQGGAVAAVIGEWTLLAVGVFALHRARPDLRVSLRTLPRALLAAGAGLAAAKLVHVPTVPNVGAVVIAAGVFAGLLLLTRAVPRELTDAVRGRA